MNHECTGVLCLLFSISTAMAQPSHWGPSQSSQPVATREALNDAQEVLQQLVAAADSVGPLTNDQDRVTASQLTNKMHQESAVITAWWAPQCRDTAITAQYDPSTTQFQDCVLSSIHRYAASLRLDLNHLSKAIDAKESAAIVHALKEVEDDLAIKAAHCSATRGGIGDSVILTIHTKQGTSDVSGWQVLILPLCDDSPNPIPDTFAKLSSPTSKEIAPGRYFVWAKNGSHISSKTPVRVGDSGGDIDWDLPIN
jgi:hypothetical protein